MSSIVGPYAPYSVTEADYRRESIAASFRDHRPTGHHLFSRRRRTASARVEG